jgi:hypothetical protein
MHKRTLFFSRIFFKHGRHFGFWNQPLNMHILICYLDSHEAGLCCYLVIHIENLLYPLDVVYFHLWPFYGRSFIYTLTYSCSGPKMRMKHK